MEVNGSFASHLHEYMAEKELNVGGFFLGFFPLVSFVLGVFKMGKMTKFSGFVAWQSTEVNGVFMCHLINQDICLTKA